MARRSVTLLVPGLAAPPRDVVDFPPTPTLDRSFARASAAPDPETVFERVLLRDFCEADLAPWAALSYWGDTGAPPAGPLLRADPLHLQAGTQHHVHFDQARLHLDAEESAALLASLNALLQTDGMALEAPTPGRWYLHLPAAPEIATQPLSHGLALGASLWAPRGPDATRFKGLLTELQMLLHDHPVNTARERLGQLPVNSLWLWGEGALPADGHAPFDLIVGGDALARGLALASGAAWCVDWPVRETSVPTPARRILWVMDALLRPAQWGDWEAWLAALRDLEDALATALKTHLASADLDFRPLAGYAYRAAPGNRWRIWRRARPFIEHLRASPA
ncbi:MAG TPA: hypothetical protein VNK45_01975 [Candidatus Acidoferrales bacterium]|nr:hypothetical protein [Candidatus Acidoferrales bacterium]